MIEIRDLTRRYGKRTAVNQLSLQVNQGDVYGFVGPNGAGKTSTIRMIVGLMRPDGGDVIVGGHSVQHAPDQVRSMIGYMPDYFGVYPDLKVWEYLDFFGACYGIASQRRPFLINELLELVELQHRREELVDRLSRGMKQRLSLARTLIHDPQVLILDEPASGLDPRARIEIRELLVELAMMGKTVFFSTHILADVAEICTRIGILEAGRLVASGGLEELHLSIMPQRRIELTLLDPPQMASAFLETLQGVANIEQLAGLPGSERSRLEFEFSGDDAALSQVLAGLLGHGVRVLHFSENNRNMEEVFLQATKGQVT
jgi:ABC-2 type transport system ATP-binding protein